jgi:hypothetical protein
VAVFGVRPVPVAGSLLDSRAPHIWNSDCQLPPEAQGQTRRWQSAPKARRESGAAGLRPRCDVFAWARGAFVTGEAWIQAAKLDTVA